MNIRNHFPGATLFALLAVINADCLVAATIPVTGNLITNLNGDSTSNYVASGTAVQVWKDLAEDGSEASRQDFGQSTGSRQPALAANTPVPNSAVTGINYNVLDFDRSASVNNGRSSGSASDTLKAKNATTARPVNYGDAFTAGQDAAYEVANAPTGLSWFAVFRSTDNSVINNNNNLVGSGSARWGRQSIIDAQYGDGSAPAGSGQNVWGTFAVDGPDGDTQVNLLNHVRDNAFNEVDNPDEGSGAGTLGNMTVSTWYMVANSYDTVNGVFRSVVTTPNGFGGTTTLVNATRTDLATLGQANGIGNGQALVNIALGQLGSGAGGNNDFSFDGLMAEVLVYNAALGASDFDSVAGYLNDKYFNIPEPTSCAFASIALLICGGAMRRRGK